MDLNFERGDPQTPRGHALIYFHDSADPSSVAATYLILLPVTVDLHKYVPPFLASQIPSGGDIDLSAFAFPPAPEPVESLDWLRDTAAARDDDLLFGGRHSLSDAPMLMGMVGEILEEYTSRYNEVRRAQDRARLDESDEGAGALSGETVDDIIYAMMSEADLLGELTKLTGRLRFALEGGDAETAGDAQAHMRAVAGRLPENRRVDLLIQAATDTSPGGGKLAQLYLDRAYALYREDYLMVKAIEEQIAGLGAPSPERTADEEG